MSRWSRAAAVFTAAGLSAVILPMDAHADTSSISVNTGSGWVHDSTTPLFDISKIAPGSSRSATLQVRNDSSDPAQLSLSATGIVEDENGCMHSEAFVDSTCGAFEGELGHELVFSVYLDPENDGTYQVTPAWTGTLYDLASPTALLAALPGGSVAGMRVDMTLPSSSGNETQTDQVGFALRLTLAGAGSPNAPGSTSGLGSSAGSEPATTPNGPDSVEVKGISVTRQLHHGVLHDITNQLPFTGTPAERLVAGALWLIIAGTALSLLATTRRRRTAAGN
jgi:hypothetical protein